MPLFTQEIEIDTDDLSKKERKIFFRELEKLERQDHFRVNSKKGVVNVEFNSDQGNKMLIYGSDLLVFTTLLWLGFEYIREKEAIDFHLDLKERGMVVDLGKDKEFFTLSEVLE